MRLDEDDEQAIEAFMGRVSALPGPVTTPDPMPLFWKAQLLRRWDAERRVQAPLDVMERVEIAAGLVAAAVLLVMALPTLARVVSTSVLTGLG